MAGELLRWDIPGGKPVYATTEQQARNISGVSAETPVTSSSASSDRGSTVTSTGRAAATAPAQQPGQVGTMNTVISTPRAGTKVPAPVVVDSSLATKDLADKKTAVDQLQVETANHQALVKTPPAPVADTKPTIPEKPQSLDEIITSELGSLQTSQDQIQKDTAATIDPLERERQDMQADYDKQAASSLKQLSDIAAGVYPLSPAETNLLSSTQATFQATIDAQRTANEAYTGQMTELMASLGINTSAPTQAVGMIHAAITTGNQKVADLNSQMSKALADLTIGFQKDDYAMVSDAWEKQSAYLENRVKAIADMEKQVADAAHQQQQDIKDFTALTLSTVMRSAEISETAKQHAIENAISQGRLSEEHRHNLVTEGTNGAGGGNFTATQINSGAANAGVPVETFKAWSADTKNMFINGDLKGTKKAIDDGLKSGSIEDVTASIKDLGLPAEAENYFIEYASSQDTGGTTADKHQQVFEDTFNDLKGQDYTRKEAYNEVVDSWTDGGKTNLTAADKRTIDKALGNIYGIRTLGIPDIQYNEGLGYTRFTGAQ